MTIMKKEKQIYFYGGMVAIIIGGVLLFYLMTYKGASGDFPTVAEKLLSLFCIISGTTYLIKYNNYIQYQDVSLDIEENDFVYNEKKYSLNEVYLTVSYTKSGGFFRSSLWLEKDDIATEIFKNIVFDIDEMANFLYMIKPYRKSDVCLAKKDIGKITLFYGGFAFQKREILYNEIEKFDITVIKADGRDFLDIKLILKNRDKIEERLIDGIQEYAKAIYAHMLFEHDGFLAFDLDCPKESIWWIIVLCFNLAVVGVITYNHQFIEIGIAVILLVTTVYISFSSSFDIALCQEVQKIHEKEQ